MKLFLDVASKYLLDKNDFYKSKANLALIISLIFWTITILTGCMIWFSKSLKFLYFLPVLLFFSILSMCIAKSLYTRSSIYNEIFEDLETIRDLANKESKRQGLQ